jgi:hypothetical protein
MAYILPRAAIVLIGWIITCGVIRNVSSPGGAIAFSIAAVSWALAGIVCFGYLHRLRGELHEPRGRP